MSDATDAKSTRSGAVSKGRFLALRLLYALIAIGLAFFVWPAFLDQVPTPAHYHGVVMAMLGAFSILCLVGIRYPLRMLPILLWELLWKAIWLMLIALPRWMSGAMDAATTQTVIDCVGVVLVLLVVPWSYVARNYLRNPGERSLDAAEPAAVKA